MLLQANRRRFPPCRPRTTAVVASWESARGEGAHVWDVDGNEYIEYGSGLRAAVAEPYVWIGLAVFGISAVVWLLVLSQASLSFAYPFAALTYVLILLFDMFVLDETVPPLRWGGVGFIAIGIFLISRTPHA